jgi:hypothetical protein
MKKELLSKIFVLSVICLFIGVGVQPAFANDISKSITFDDTIPPEVILTWETEEQSHHKWFILFRMLCWDNQSGMSEVHFFLNGKLQSIVPYRGWIPFEERFVWLFYNVSLEFLTTATFKFIALDRAYNSVTVEVDGLDISYDVVENKIDIQPTYTVKRGVSTEDIENVEDCDCQTVINNEDLIRIEKAIDGLEGNVRLLSIFPKRNLEIKELSNRISTFSDSNIAICLFLFIILIGVLEIHNTISDILEYGNWGNSPILEQILIRMFNRWENRLFIVSSFLNAFNCDEYWNP